MPKVTNAQESIITPRLSEEEISTRMLLRVYVGAEAFGDSAPSLSEATNVYLENGEYIFHFIANENQDFVINGKNYYSAEIKRTDINTSADGKIEKIDITLSNKWKEWASVFAYLGNILNNKKCEVLEYLPDYPYALSTNPVLIFSGKINAPRMNSSTFQWEVRRSFVDFDSDSPNVTFAPPCPYVFKDSRCKYTGEATFCDKVVSTCVSYGNILNYGGHPSVPREMVIK